MNKNIFRQTDSRWASLPYPTKSSNMGSSGCGCCACTHIIIERTKYKDYTPADVRPYMVKQGFAVAGKGTLWSGITKTLQHYGFKVINHDTMTDLWTTLNRRKKEGKRCMGVILFRSGTKGGVTWTTCGHYVAFVDYKVANGKHYLYTKDSGGRMHDGWYCYETTMRGLIPQVWSAILKLNKTSTPSIVSKELDACKDQAIWMKSAKYGWQKNPTLANTKIKGTCVSFVAVVLQRIGILKNGQALWHNGKGYGTGKVTGANDKMTVTYMGNKSIASLKDKLKAGDIILLDDNKSGVKGSGGHIFIMTGKWKGDDPYIWDMEPNRKCVKTQKSRVYSGKRKVLARVRLKG